MGYRRAGWYAYDRFDNDAIPSAERIIPGLHESLYFVLFEVPDFLSERKQLLGINRRAERGASRERDVHSGKRLSLSERLQPSLPLFAHVPSASSG